MKSFVSGCAGPSLTSDERSFFRNEQPWGLILFGRNVETSDQLRRLCEEFREAVGDPGRPILIDQEGGRVQRLRPPISPNYPSNSEIAENFGTDPVGVRRAVYLLSRLHAFDLAPFGIDVNCLPVLDVPSPSADPVIGSRAYGHKPELVATLGRVACEGLLDGGVLPVIKHMPGHGRGDVDSHKALPRVHASLADLATWDFVPFARLSDMPLGMTAHVVYESIDVGQPGTCSPIVIDEIIRGAIGFDGLLFSDDISMHALDGTFEDRTHRLLEAGCDVALHCNGVFEEMLAVANAAAPLSADAKRRTDIALAMRNSGDDADEAALRSEFAELTGHSAFA